RLGERLPQAQRGRAGAANPATNAQAEPERTRGRCAFCGDPVPAVVDVETRCGACASPLAPLAVLAARSGREQHGRRASTRVRKSDSARLHLARGQPPAAARLRDLSPTGLSLFTPAAVSVGSTVRVVAPDFDLVAVVVQVRRQEALRIVHARLLTGWFAARRATFVSMRV
ncbi:MAG: PilZ domain-containing protein, partial [Gammaproteobacteria bacterium]